MLNLPLKKQQKFNKILCYRVEEIGLSNLIVVLRVHLNIVLLVLVQQQRECHHQQFRYLRILECKKDIHLLLPKEQKCIKDRLLNI